MSFDQIIDSPHREGIERGEFDNLPGKGRSIDLTEYVETWGEVRMTNSVLKSAGMTSPEVGLLKKIAGLKQTLAQCWMRRKTSRSGSRSSRAGGI